MLQKSEKVQRRDDFRGSFEETTVIISVLKSYKIDLKILRNLQSIYSILFSC